MAPFDRFRKQKPQLTPRASSGRAHMNGLIRPDELNPNLANIISAQRIWDRMWRTDADVRKALLMVINPIASATYMVEPYGGEDATPEDEQVAEFVHWAIHENMRPGLSAHLWEALRVCFRGGFVPFEQVWESTDYQGKPVLAPRHMGLMLPRTIWRWEQDGYDLTAITQQPDAASSLTLPIEDVLYYRVGIEGDNWEGESLLRAAYKHWKYKEQLELVDAIAQERFRIGIPIGYPPRDATAEQIESLEDAVASIRSNEAGEIVMPGPHQQHAEKGEGWLIEILTPHRDTSGSQTMDRLNYESDRISASVLQEFMRLGQSGTGARALGDVQQDPFLAFTEALCGVVVEDVWNEQMIPRLVSLNFGHDRFPKLKASLIDKTTISELGDFFQKAVAAGALHPDPILEEWLRKRADLPPVDPEAAAQRQEVEAAQRDQILNPPPPVVVAPGQNPPAGKSDAPSKGTPPPKDQKTMTLARQQRDLTWWEQGMQLDRIEASIDGARDRFEQAGMMAAHQMAVDLAARAVGDKRIPKPDPGPLRDALHAEMRRLYATGRDTVRNELAQQRPAPRTMMSLATPDEPASLLARAAAAADSIVSGVVGAMRNAALRNLGHARVQQAGEAAGRAALRANAQEHAAAVLNAGRSDQADSMADEIEGSRYTSILDGNRCRDCAEADDNVLRPLSDPVRLARMPPNPDCQGGAKCRCLEFFELKGEAAPAV